VPLFSIPSSASWGIGEIGDIPALASWLASARQDLLQLLPINEMAVGQTSPYSAMTAMAIDPIFISVHRLPEFEAVGGGTAMGPDWKRRLDAARQSPAVDYRLVRGLKEEALRTSFGFFVDHEWSQRSSRAQAMSEWVEHQRWWLDDYVLFRSIHARQRNRPWMEWPEPLRRRQASALEEARRELADEMLYRGWLQWVADEQWRAAREACGPVALLGDLPFMVDGDSADVWANAEAFRLDASVGAPPDAFSESGQNWGLPVYRWDVMKERNWGWLRARARRSASLFDGYRVDHLVGFYRTYVFPKEEGRPSFTPESPEDQLALGETVLGVFAEPGALIIAEDLGTIPDFVRASLARLGVPGYKVFRWERQWKQAGKPYRDTKAYPSTSVAASGTHDTETVAEWWDNLDEIERRKVVEAPGLAALLAERHGLAEVPDVFTPELRDALLELLFGSGSDLLLLPIQDVFGWRDRVNVPASQGEHNWTWRLPWPVDTLCQQLEATDRASRVREWSSRYGRWRHD
jgi:4-alpha-glucanotransferase